MVGELAATKVWTININDSVSLYQCLMGRCASVLRSGDFEKMSAQRASGEMIDAESDVLTFAVECLYFDTDDEAEKNLLLRNWVELAKAKGVQLRESPTNVSIRSKHPGHSYFGVRCQIASPSLHSWNAVSVKIVCMDVFEQ